jgi:hypothetical protein
MSAEAVVVKTAIESAVRNPVNGVVLFMIQLSFCGELK